MIPGRTHPKKMEKALEASSALVVAAEARGVRSRAMSDPARRAATGTGKVRMDIYGYQVLC